MKKIDMQRRIESFRLNILGNTACLTSSTHGLKISISISNIGTRSSKVSAIHWISPAWRSSEHLIDFILCEYRKIEGWGVVNGKKYLLTLYLRWLWVHFGLSSMFLCQKIMKSNWLCCMKGYHAWILLLLRVNYINLKQWNMIVLIPTHNKSISVTTS